MFALSGVVVSKKVVAENTRLKKKLYKGVILLNHLVTKKEMEWKKENKVNQNSRLKK